MAKDIKILVSGGPRNLAWSYRNNLNSYFKTHKNSEQSFYWEILVGSVRYGLVQYCKLATHPESKELAQVLTDKLSSLKHPADAEVVATLLQQILQLWDTEEFQHDFNTTWDPETLHTKFVPLARELLHSKRDISHEDLIESNFGVTGITEDQRSYGKSRVTTTLIGGRRAERRKWVHAFDGVSAVLLFISAETFLIERSTGYVEDWQSTMAMIREVSGSRFLTNVPLFLFISRINLFEDMISGGADVKKFLPDDYTGEINARSIVLHFVDKFSEVRAKDKPLFVICGNLVDRQAMQMIIPFIFQTLVLADNSTKQLSDVNVDNERNLVVFYPTVHRSTLSDDVLKAVKQVAEPSILSSLLRDSDDVCATCASLLSNPLHADLKLKIGETVLHAHSLLLQARVPELLALWTDNGTSDEIEITDMDSATTQQFLEYVYTDSIKSVADQELTAVKGVLELLTFAEKYALQPFMRYLCRIAADQLSISEDQNSKSMDTRLVQELLQFSEAASSDYLKLKCTECLLLLEADNTPAKVTQEKKIKKRPGCSIC